MRSITPHRGRSLAMRAALMLSHQKERVAWLRINRQTELFWTSPVSVSSSASTISASNSKDRFSEEEGMMRNTNPRVENACHQAKRGGSGGTRGLHGSWYRMGRAGGMPQFLLK